MSLPTVNLYAAFISGTANISAYGRDSSWTVRRGNTSGTPVANTSFVADAGNYSVTLSSQGRRFDQTNVSGPYVTAGVSDVVPGVVIVKQAVWAATTYNLFTGAADAWPIQFPMQVDQTVGLSATDNTNRLANATFSLSRALERSGSRIGAVLSQAGYGGATSLSSGAAIIAPITIARGDAVSAWSHLTDVVNAEGFGDLYFAQDGTLTFRDRYLRLSDTRSNTSQATFGGSGLQYSDITLGSPPIVNDCTVTYSNNRSAHAQDSTSISKQWALRSAPPLNVPLLYDLDATALAQWLVYKFAYPITTVTSVSFKPTRTPTSGATSANNYWPQALGRELGDRITIVTPATAGSISHDCWIRGIQHEYANRDWTTTFFVEDASWSTLIARYDSDVYDGTKVYGL